MTEQISWGFQACHARQPSAAELAILTRGYGAKRKPGETTIVSNMEDLEKLSPESIGDEPFMMLEEFKQLDSEVLIVVDSNRYRGAQALLDAGSPVDVFILDGPDLT